jgi:hypothetical protein
MKAYNIAQRPYATQPTETQIKQTSKRNANNRIRIIVVFSDLDDDGELVGEERVADDDELVEEEEAEDYS